MNALHSNTFSEPEPVERPTEEWDGKKQMPQSWEAFIVHCIAQGMNKKQTLEDETGLNLTRGGTPVYQRCSDFYNTISRYYLQRN